MQLDACVEGVRRGVGVGVERELIGGSSRHFVCDMVPWRSIAIGKRKREGRVQRERRHRYR